MSETVTDILEEIADQLGIYGSCRQESNDCSYCDCRIGWINNIEKRIYKAFEEDALL